MFIKCDLWSFSFSFFLLLAIYSKNVVQKRATELCKSRKKTFLMKFFLKSCRLQLRKEFFSKVISREIRDFFLEQFLPRTVFG